MLTLNVFRHREISHLNVTSFKHRLKILAVTFFNFFVATHSHHDTRSLSGFFSPETQIKYMKQKMTGMIGTIILMSGVSSQAAVIVSDDFEGSGSFSGDWASTANTTITNGTGAAGTANFASVASGGGNASLGGTFSDGGASDFYVDFYVQVANSTGRQLSFQLSSVTASPNTNQATLNLRYENGGWGAFQAGGPGWVSISGLTALTDDEWHRVRVTGSDWGTATASYGIEVSAAGATTFNSSSTGLTSFHSGTPLTIEAQSFNFNARYGNNPGFNIDQVDARTIEGVPEPSSALLSLLGGLALLRRRR